MTPRLVIIGTTLFSVIASLAGCLESKRSSVHDTTSTEPEAIVVPHSPVPSAIELAERAEAALPRPRFDLQRTPALPLDWPPSGAEVEWLFYRSRALPTGAVTYEVTGPTHRISMALPDGDPRVETLENATIDGARRRGIPDADPDDLGRAEQVLIEVLMQHRSPESARGALHAYVDWATTTVIGGDVRRRKPEFFDWLQASR
ncbi:MAG: hypothetical protein KDC38_03970 [Planctomycetes bacterium]|nr:hypothetical protein [Planctomycetota bacterium]